MKVLSLVLATVAFVCLAGCEEQKTKPTPDKTATSAAPASKEAPAKDAHEKKDAHGTTGGGW